MPVSTAFWRLECCVRILDLIEGHQRSALLIGELDKALTLFEKRRLGDVGEISPPQESHHMPAWKIQRFMPALRIMEKGAAPSEMIELMEKVLKLFEENKLGEVKASTKRRRSSSAA